MNYCFKITILAEIAKITQRWGRRPLDSGGCGLCSHTLAKKHWKFLVTPLLDITVNVIEMSNTVLFLQYFSMSPSFYMAFPLFILV